MTNISRRNTAKSTLQSAESLILIPKGKDFVEVVDFSKTELKTIHLYQLQGLVLSAARVPRTSEWLLHHVRKQTSSMLSVHDFNVIARTLIRLGLLRRCTSIKKKRRT